MQLNSLTVPINRLSHIFVRIIGGHQINVSWLLTEEIYPLHLPNMYLHEKCLVASYAPSRPT
jgi:hypothetical protein